MYHIDSFEIVVTEATSTTRGITAMASLRMKVSIVYLPAIFVHASLNVLQGACQNGNSDVVACYCWVVFVASKESTEGWQILSVHYLNWL